MQKVSAFLSLLLACVLGITYTCMAATTSLPRLSSISPASAVVGTSITIHGANFGSTQGSSKVTFNGVAASVSTWGEWTIIAKVPVGATSGNVVVTVGGNASNGVDFTIMTAASGSLLPSNFGFQCGLDTSDCGGPRNTIVWPQTPSATPADPGFLRLHDAGTSWSDLSTGSGTYDWTTLDTWLDTIAQHEPVRVIQTFSWVPCWDASPCEAMNIAPTGTNVPPRDLTANGSASFNEFVTQFVQHCSPNGNCAGNCPAGQSCTATNLIRYYEMWNEWNTTRRWTGTINQLYEMLAPAVSIIRANVTNAIILTPSTTSAASSSFTAWLNLETANGTLSDWVNWHEYLNDSTPESQWSEYGAVYVSIQYSLPAWQSKPWADTETNWDVDTFACPSRYSATDCTGQIARWQLLHASNGTRDLNWYKWEQSIGSNAEYETAYSYLMQYLMGGQFSAPCASANGATWTCSFTEANGTAALWVWTPNESGATFSVPAGYVDYVDLTGGKTAVNGGQSIAIKTMPVMLEQ